MARVTVTDTFGNLAARVMEKFGADATLKRVVEAYDETLDETVVTTTQTTILVVLDDVEVENKAGVKTKQTVLRSNTPLALDDRIILNGKVYRVESLKETSPQGTPIFWEAVVC